MMQYTWNLFNNNENKNEWIIQIQMMGGEVADGNDRRRRTAYNDTMNR